MNAIYQRPAFTLGDKEIEIMEINKKNNIVLLDRSLGPLKGRFNVCKNKIRFLALLSPTCPL